MQFFTNKILLITGSTDEPKWRLRNPGVGLCRGECEHEGDRDYPELYGSGR